MPFSLAYPNRAHTAAALPITRWICLVALATAELIALAVRFDTESLLAQQGWWAQAVGQSHIVPELGIVAAAATVLLGGARLWGELRQLSDCINRPRWFWACLVGHLVALAGFVQLARVVLEGGLEKAAHPGAWVAAWAGVGLVTLGLWCAAAMPGRAWWALAQRGYGVVLAGITIGMVGWTAGWLSGQLWRPLGRSTFWMVERLLGLVLDEVICRASDFTVGSRSFSVHIAPSCSGYEGIGLLWVFLTAYFWLYRRALRFPHALLLLPIGTALVWAANTVRIAGLVLVGTYVSPTVALGGFHSQVGWLAFNAIALGLVAATSRMGLFRAEGTTAGGTNATAAYLGPLLALVATGMVTGAFSAGGLDRLYPVRVLAAVAVLGWYRQEYRAVRWRASWAAVAIGVAAFVVWMALARALSVAPGDPHVGSSFGTLPPGWALAWIAFRVLGFVLVVPVAEELAFRGYLTRRLVAADFQSVPLGRFTWIAWVASSLAFGAMHGSRWIAGTLAGMLYAWALSRRGELADAMTAHATTNALIVAYVMATGDGSAWG